ncbi:FAD-binding oxidoreductase [bacterium]|nr:FAD-binding oxidoreductase [bacterium]
MNARVVIIGGGVIGLAIAYHLTRGGAKNVVVLDREHLNAGATGRCGGGVRQQWSSGLNVRITRRAVELFKALPIETGHNVWFRQGGYLFLAKSPAQLASLETNVLVEHEYGAKTRVLDVHEIGRRWPFLNLDGVAGGSFNAEDGVLFPFSVVWALAEGVRQHGGEVRTHVEVTGLDTAGNRVTRVRTNAGDIDADIVINAAGAWSPAIASMAGVRLPNYAEKHEAIVTEPLRPFLDPNVVPMDSGVWISQTMRGEIYACLGVDKGPANDYDPTWKFIRTISRRLVELIPRLSGVKVLRQWGGFYDVTPDANPIVGHAAPYENFWQCHGFVGHGFMMAPAVGEIVAARILRGTDDEIFWAWRLSRFEEGETRRETMIIG